MGGFHTLPLPHMMIAQLLPGTAQQLLPCLCFYLTSASRLRSLRRPNGSNDNFGAAHAIACPDESAIACPGDSAIACPDESAIACPDDSAAAVAGDVAVRCAC